MDLQDKNLQKIITAVKLVGGKRLIVFGSRARGKEKKNSDLDLCLLVSDDKNLLEYKKKLRLKLWDLGYNWQWPLDLHVYSKDLYQKRITQGDPFVEEISKGVILYE